MIILIIILIGLLFLMIKDSVMLNLDGVSCDKLIKLENECKETLWEKINNGYCYRRFYRLIRFRCDL